MGAVWVMYPIPKCELHWFFHSDSQKFTAGRDLVRLLGPAPPALGRKDNWGQITTERCASTLPWVHLVGLVHLCLFVCLLSSRSLEN